MKKLGKDLGLQFGVFLGIGIEGITGLPPFNSDLVFDWYKRSGYTLTERITGDDAQIVGGDVGEVLVSGVLTFPDLTGVTIVDSDGDNVPVKVGDTITFAAGNYSYLLLSDGTEMFFNGHTFDSFSGLEIAQTGFTFTFVSTGQLKSVLAGLDRGYTQRGALQIIYKSLNLKVTADVGGDEEIDGGKLDNLINKYWSTNPTGSVDAKFDLLDRVNQTADSTTSIYYVATDRITRSLYWTGKLFNEFDITIMDSYMLQADKEKAYAQMLNDYCDIKQIGRFFVYATQKTGQDAVDVHNFTNNNCQLVTDGGLQVFHLTLPVWIDLTP